MKTQITAVIFGFILIFLVNVSFAQSGNYKQQFNNAVPEKVCSNFGTSDLASSGNYKQSVKSNSFNESALADNCCDNGSCMGSGCCENGTCTKACCTQNHISGNYKQPYSNEAEYSCDMNAACCEGETSCCN